MINQQTLQGHWNEIRGELRKRWGQLTQDDLQKFNGNVDQLVGLIQRKTGETRGSIEEVLNSFAAQGSSAVAQATEDVRQYVQHAADRIQEGSEQAVETLRQGYEDAEEMVRQSPSTSVAISLGAGLFLGLILGLTLRRS